MATEAFFWVAPPLTFIWRHDRRLDKSTQASSKYKPIEQSEQEQETSKVLNGFPKTVFLALFLADFKAVVICEVAMSTSLKPLIVQIQIHRRGLAHAESMLQYW